jgi:hypothetical protein
MREKNNCGEVIYVGDVQEPEKVNGTCMKAVHMGTMGRGFSVIIFHMHNLYRSKLDVENEL